jgi:hypothetical protein
MKRINIISETIYKGQHKLVNQGAFINMSDLMTDIFSCFGITCCNGLLQSKSDYFIRRAYLIQSRKKPGANWQSLNKMVLDVYNCCKGTTLCPSLRSEQWWITTDVIRPAKTIETINFTPIIDKVLNCCGITQCGCPPTINFDVTSSDWSSLGIANQTDFENYILGAGATSVVVTYFDLTANKLQANIAVTGLSVFSLALGNITAVDKIGGFDNTLLKLYLNDNLLTAFNPTTSLPITLIELDLSANLITTAGYTASEPWANAQPSFSSNCDIFFMGNVNSVTGTNLETILLTKNCTITP